MFENLKDDPQFKQLDLAGRTEWLEQYKVNKIAPVVQGLEASEQAKYYSGVDEVFWKQTAKSDWEAFKSTSADIITGIPRLAMKATELGWDAVKLGAGIIGANSIEEYAAQQSEYLDKWEKSLIQNPDSVFYSNLMAEGGPINGFIGKVMFNYKTLTSPWARGFIETAGKKIPTPFMEATGMTAGNAAAAYAMTGTAGDLAIGAAMQNYVQPAIDATDMSPEAKMYSTLASYLVLGFGSGMTLEYKFDKMIGNPVFKNVIDDAMASAVRSSTPEIPGKLSATGWEHLTKEEQAMLSLVDASDGLRTLARIAQNAEPTQVINEKNMVQAAEAIKRDLLETATARATNPQGAGEVHKTIMASPEVNRLLAASDDELDWIETMRRQTDGEAADWIHQRQLDDELNAQDADVQEWFNSLRRDTPEAKARVQAELDGKKKETLARRKERQKAKKEERVEQELDAFRRLGQQESTQQLYSDVVSAYQRGPLLGKRTLAQAAGRKVSEVPSAMHEAVQRHVKEFGDTKVQPKPVEAAQKPVEVESEPIRPVEVAPKPEAVRPTVEEPVTKPVETKPVEAEAPVRKVAPTQPAAATPAIRTTNNLPIRDHVIDDPELGVVRMIAFAENAKPSHAQTQVMKEAGAKFNNKYMAWVMPEGELAKNTGNVVRKMAAPAPTPDPQVVTPTAAASSTPNLTSVKGSPIVSEFITPAGGRVVKFDKEALPTLSQKVWMQKHGIYWQPSYKGWLGPDTDIVRRVIKQVREMAEGRLPDGVTDDMLVRTQKIEKQAKGSFTQHTAPAPAAATTAQPITKTRKRTADSPAPARKKATTEEPVKRLWVSVEDELEWTLKPGLVEEGSKSQRMVYSDDLEQQYPAAYSWLNQKHNTRSFYEYDSAAGATENISVFTDVDIITATRNAYNKYAPGAVIPKDELAAHIKVLNELEEIIEPLRSTLKEVDWHTDLAKLRKIGVLNEQAYLVAKHLMEDFQARPNFKITSNKGLKEHYNFLTNVINIKNADNLFHELGHWGWWQVLKGKDRIKFFEKLYSGKYDETAWNKMWPARKVVGAIVDTPLATPAMKAAWQGPMRNVTELYADMVRHYVHTYRMDDVDSLAFVRKNMAEFEPVLAVLRNATDTPDEMRKFVDDMLMTPRGRGPRTTDDVKEYIHTHEAYFDKKAFEASLKNVADDAYEDGADDILMEIMRNQATDMSAWKKTGDIEPFINRILVDVLGHVHYKTGDVERIERSLGELAEFFSPASKETSLRLIMKGQQALVENAKMPKEAMMQLAKEMRAEYQGNYLRTAELYGMAKHVVNETEVGDLTLEAFINKQQTLLSDIARRNKVNDPRNKRAVEFDENKHDSFTDDLDPLGDAAMRARRGGDDAIWTGAMTQNTLMRWRLAPHLVGMSMGLEVDDDNGIQIPFTNVKVNWNPVTWAKRGAWLSAYDVFGKGLWKASKTLMLNKWAQLPPATQTDLVKKFNTTFKSDLVRGILPNSGLKDELIDIRKAKWRMEGAFKRRVENFAQDVNRRLTLDEQQLLGNVISKEQGFTVGMLSPEALVVKQQVEQLVQDTHAMLRQTGISQQLLDEKGMDIIPLVFNKPFKHWRSMGGEGRRAQNIHETLSTKFLAHQGRNEAWKHSDTEVASLMQYIRNTGGRIQPGDAIDEFIDANGGRLLLPHGQGGPNALQTWTVKSFNSQQGTIKVNRKFTDLEKTIMKAESAIVPRLAQFAEDVSAYVARAKTFESLATNRNLTIDIAEMRRLGQVAPDVIDTVERNQLARGWVYVPDTEVIPGVKRFGQLAGQLVEPEVMYVLKAETSTAPTHPLANEIFTKYRQGVSLWKIGKTAFNPTTHGINFLGNSVMCMMDGRNPLNVLREGAVGLKQKGAYYHEAVEAGMVDSNILRSELGLDKWMRSMDAQVNQHPTHGFWGATTTWIDGVSKLAKNVSTKAAYWPMRTYELGDQVYKMGVFVQARKAGKDPIEAMAEANRLFFDYRDVPQGVKIIRDWGVMPFVSYTYKLLPRMADFAVNNPHRLQAMVGGFALLNSVLMANAFGEDFEDVQKFYDKVTPEWMNKKMFGTDTRAAIYRGQGLSENGQAYAEWLDFSQIIPGATMLDDGGIFGGFPFGTNPVLSIMYGLQANKDATIEQQIAPYPDTTDPELKKRNIEARLKFVARSLLPNLPIYPGAYSLERLGQGLTASGVIPQEEADLMGWTGKDYYGTPEDATDAIGSLMSGVRSRRLYADQEAVRQMDKYSFGIKKAENEFERRVVDQRMSDTELEASKNQMIKVIHHNSQELSDLGKVYGKAQTALVRDRTKR